MLLLKLILKNFQNSFKDYLFFFIYQSFMVVIFFILTGFFQMALELSKLNDISSLTAFILVSITILLSITLISTNMNLKNYLLIRNKDYAFLIVFGICSRMLYLLLAIEFIIGSFFSILGGLLGGTLCIAGIKLFLVKIGFTNALLLTTIWSYLGSTLIFLLIIVICIFINFKGLSQLGGQGTGGKNENHWKNHKAWDPILLLLGGLIDIGIILNLWLDYSVLKSLISIVLLIVSSYFIISSGSRWIFEKIRKNKKWYYKRLLISNQIMSKFNKNKKLLFIIFSMNFLIFYLMGSSTASYWLIVNPGYEDQIIMIIFTLISLIIILHLGSTIYFRFFTDENQLIKDSVFLKSLGMPDKMIANLYKKETFLLFFSSILISFLWSGFFFSSEMKFQNADFLESGSLFLGFSISCFIIEFLFYKAIERRLIAHISKVGGK